MQRKTKITGLLVALSGVLLVGNIASAQMGGGMGNPPRGNQGDNAGLMGGFEGGRMGDEMGRGGRGGRGGMGPVRAIVQQAAESTGLDVQDIATQLRDGATLGSILTGAGVDVNAFVEELLVEPQERLAQAVSEGRISQEIADARLNLMRLELSYRINNAKVQAPTPDATTPEAEATPNS